MVLLAWVLWLGTDGYVYGRNWRILGVFDTRSDCAVALVRVPGDKILRGQIKQDSLQYDSSSFSSVEFVYKDGWRRGQLLCLPDTVDPRPR